MLWLALAPFAAAALAPTLVHKMGAKAAWILAIVPAILFLGYASMVPLVAHGETLTAGVDWAPSLGVRYAQMIDGLSLTFALLVTGIGTFIVIYAGGYLAGHHHQGRFLAFLLLFMGAMLGLVVADDLISLFVFYELTSITSFLLIGFDHTREPARRAAVQALVITGGGGLALLAGLVLIRLVSGETSVTGLLASPDVLRDAPAYTAIFILVCLGAFTKSAQVPFHSWLPNAMEAPTPVSAYLHSATMVKAGVFVLMRFAPVLGDTALWGTVLPLFGGATFLTGVILGVRQTDLKQILAYTTVASLGLLVMLTGMGSEYAIAGAVAYLVAHALFKGALFMVAGCIDHETGTRDIRQLGGLVGKMPVTFVAALLGCLSMAGLPPMIGFVAKEVMYDGLWQIGGVSVATIVAVAGNALMFCIAGMVLVPFFKRPGTMPKKPHEGPPSLWLGPVVLGVTALAAALGLELAVEWIIGPMTSAVAGHASELHLHLWPTGLYPPVILTLVTVGTGFLLFLIYVPLRKLVAGILDAVGWGPDRGFDQLLGGLVGLAYRVTRIAQPGIMQRYVTMTFVVLAVALLAPLAIDGLPSFVWPTDLSEPHYFVVLATAVAGLGIVIVAKSRLVAIISLGVQGVMVALIFMLYGAPDLSFTQFMVETLSVIILALVMTRLDLDTTDHRLPGHMAKDAGIAIACGVGFAVLLYGVVRQPLDMRLSEFYLKYAYEVAHGRNVVNVILVDFRALDTLGEIAVVMAAGLAIFALLRLAPLPGRDPSPPAERSGSAPASEVSA
ncbi:putative monovalent cation/H+ antiporter subunit A [Acuticoccus sp. I52.16.1]|uniref:putative monovalent cation/H+ antiporter subunit A n=1 Tax=Acuticoccus sp. I52.16.1 TaxID=2928472 RepID=UPI001FD2530F|nr:putative monovalent cation/H+ antiporter subunit A [Acuticoccus sp. I52.16.1]UOM36997.1 putative monovalent cation/H+ antiporter subunit A [Acuticoccus sp. I52.16.1]